MSEGKKIETHNTCTSNPVLEKTPGSLKESINVKLLNKLYQKIFGAPVSDDPVVARIQREQAIAKHKRSQKK